MLALPGGFQIKFETALTSNNVITLSKLVMLDRMVSNPCYATEGVRLHGVRKIILQSKHYNQNNKGDRPLQLLLIKGAVKEWISWY